MCAAAWSLFQTSLADGGYERGMARTSSRTNVASYPYRRHVPSRNSRRSRPRRPPRIISYTGCRGASFSNLAVLPYILPGVTVADVVAIMGSVDPVFGEVDR